jgi:2-methylcitrate dehydratase PrpD
MLDNLACAFAGRDAEGVAAAASITADAGNVRVPATALRRTAGDAVFVHSVMARALDYCDVLSPGYHPSSTDIPVALAVAQSCNSSGLEVLQALVAGQDVAQRINRAAQAGGMMYRGFDSSMLGLFSGTVVAGRLLGLDADALRNAVGLAWTHGCGTFQAIQDKALAVRFVQGNVARAAVQAAQLSRHGVTGPAHVLDGEYGFFATYAPGSVDRSFLSAGLGEQWLGETETCFKLYPSCGVTLALTDAALALRPAVVGRRLSALRIACSSEMMALTGQPYQPDGNAAVQAMFSAQYVLASALLRGRSTLDCFSHEAARDDEATSLARQVEVRHEPAFRHFDECEVMLEAEGGGTWRRHVKHGRGWPQNPASDEDLHRKLSHCLDHSGVRDPSRQSRDIAAAVQELDEMPDLTRLLAALEGGA